MIRAKVHLKDGATMDYATPDLGFPELVIRVLVPGEHYKCVDVQLREWHPDAVGTWHYDER